MLDVLTRLRSFAADDLFDFERSYRRSPFNRLRLLKNTLLRRGRPFRARMDSDLAQAYIAAAAHPGGTRHDYLERGLQLLARVTPDAASGLTWDEARLLAARVRMEV
jgi:hypothetical protein